MIGLPTFTARTSLVRLLVVPSAEQMLEVDWFVIVLRVYVVFRILKQDKFVPNGNYLIILHHGYGQIKFLEPQNRVCAGPRSVLQLRVQQSTRI